MTAWVNRLSAHSRSFGFLVTSTSSTQSEEVVS